MQTRVKINILQQCFDKGKVAGRQLPIPYTNKYSVVLTFIG